MKNYKLTPYEKENFCVCCSLQAILRKHGIEYTQERIASNLTPSETGGFYINDQRIKEFMERTGFEYTHFYHNTTPFNEPDMLLKDMDAHDGIIGIRKAHDGIIGIRKDDNHVFLLEEFRDPTLMVLDPVAGDTLTINI